ncbi:MAG TPA: 50S ribosomal protein L15 [Candidatus Saccharimonadales bacterium]|nr:50S ribosomal protein L15 [Candidatus Saccharimonadales bacterium]
MKYNELNVTANKKANRVGRGIAAGQGKTAGRGTKGQKSRTGSTKKPGFTGGQTPIMQALPKLPGFKSKRIKMENVYTGELDQFAGKTIDTTVLAEAGLVSNPFVRVKLLVKGDVEKKLDVKLQGASETAIAAIQNAGGTFEKVAQVLRPVTSTSEKKQAKAEAKEA